MNRCDTTHKCACGHERGEHVETRDDGLLVLSCYHAVIGDRVFCPCRDFECAEENGGAR